MKITLVKKTDQSDKDPLLCQWETEDEKGVTKKNTIKIAIGQSIDVPDEEAYTLLAKYKGLFIPADQATKSMQTKVVKTYADKALAAQ